MIDLRYHIYSLAAVFLALAVGVVIGTSFTATSPVAKQSGKLTRMERMVNRLEKDFKAVRAEITEKENQIHLLQESADRSEAFSRAVLPVILKERLAWRNVAIVQTGDYDIADQIKAALEVSGAHVTSVTKIAKAHLLEQPQTVAQITANLGLPPPTQSERKAAPIFRALVSALSSARGVDALARLEDMKIVTRSGDYTRWNRIVVIVGGSARENRDFSEQVDTPLIEEFRAEGFTIVGCEPTDAIGSYMKTYRKSGIATVDNADKAAGQVALVCALAGETGHFGVKSTAERFLPASIEGHRR